MQFIELGTPGQKGTATGWLARYLATASNLPSEIILPSLAVGNLQTTSLLGDYETVNMSSADQFNMNIGPWRWRPSQRQALRHLYQADTTWLHASGLQALNAMDVVELNVGGDYVPSNGAVYPGGQFGDHLQLIARFHPAAGFSDQFVRLYLATGLTEVGHDRQGPEESHMTVERVALDDVPGLIATGELIDSKTIIGLLLAREHLASGSSR